MFLTCRLIYVNVHLAGRNTNERLVHISFVFQTMNWFRFVSLCVVHLNYKFPVAPAEEHVRWNTILKNKLNATCRSLHVKEEK